MMLIGESNVWQWRLRGLDRSDTKKNKYRLCHGLYEQFWYVPWECSG